MIRGRLHRHRDADDGKRADGDVIEGDVVEIEASALAGVFAAPKWLRDLGWMAWLLVGVAAFLAGAVWLLALTQTIVLPVITAAILATVLSPVMRWLERHRVGRGLGTAIVFVSLVVLGVLVVLVVVGGISSQSGDLTANLHERRRQDRGLARGPGREPELRRGRQGGCEFVAERCLPRPDQRRQHRYRRARGVGDVPVLHGAQPRLPAQGRTDDQGAGASVTSASRSRSRTRSRAV